MTDDDREGAPARDEAPKSEAAEPEPAEEWESRFKYLYADFENFRRRTERERERITRESRGAMLRELLPIVEAFRRAHDAAAALDAAHPLRRGFELLEREWTTFLKHEGVTPVAEVGAPFRADEAEAVGETAPREGVEPGAIAEVVQQGYRYFGGILRPAKVVVARAPPESAGPPVPAAETEERS